MEIETESVRAEACDEEQEKEKKTRSDPQLISLNFSGDIFSFFRASAVVNV
jgi:hypothetical protein